jgi:hypothetical protein
MWKTRDGRLIDVKNMSSNHLCNAIKMLERTNSGAACRKWIQILESELKKRGQASKPNSAWAEECNDACI